MERLEPHTGVEEGPFQFSVKLESRGSKVARDLRDGSVRSPCVPQKWDAESR